MAHLLNGSGTLALIRILGDILPIASLPQVHNDRFLPTPNDEPNGRLIGRGIDLLMRHVGWDEQEVPGLQIDFVLQAGPQALRPDKAVRLIYLRFPLLDGPGNGHHQLRLAIDAVARLIEARVSTLICCGAGMSRSPAIAAAALTIAIGSDLDESLRAVVKQRPADVSPALLAEIKAALQDHRQFVHPTALQP